MVTSMACWDTVENFIIHDHWSMVVIHCFSGPKRSSLGSASWHLPRRWERAASHYGQQGYQLERGVEWWCGGAMVYSVHDLFSARSVMCRSIL